MSKNKVIKPVAFNITNQLEAKMLEHVKRRNFSGYVKELILRDIQSRDEKTPQIEPVCKPGEALTPAQRLEQARKNISMGKNSD
jgi:hypothetical protein